MFYDTLPAPNVGKVKAGEKMYDWVSWGEVLAPKEGTTALARYANQYYANGVAAVTRAVGKGSVTYIVVDWVDGALEAVLIHGVYERAGVKIEHCDDGFVVDWRDGFWVATNFTEKQEMVPAGEGVKMLWDVRELGPAGVGVWQGECSIRGGACGRR